MNTPHARPPRAGSVAPTRASTDPPAEPSEFMTTSVQLPAAGFQVSVCAPEPAACATQKFCAPGGVAGAPEPVRIAGGEPEPRSVTTVRSTLPRQAVASATRAMPTNTSEPELPVTWIFAVPNAAETGTQLAPLVVRST